ncbi:MAG: hypothetical protein HKO12_01005 [Woeseiaceae bacterium]|nr:hypothetical protein [Woeseiaceae bacterium]
MRYKTLFIVATLAVTPQALSETDVDQPVVTMDENLWVAFYDVPSRRFRDIRAAFIRRQFDRASTDLATSASYLTVEASRALPAIAERLADVSTRMAWISVHIDDATVTAEDLDSLFSRAHWLLAQHFLDMARRSRVGGQNRNAGLYLWATTHHLERAVLWSNSRISGNVQKTLDDLRELADRLQDKESVRAAYREKPLLQAEKLLQKLGKTIDRPIVLPLSEPGA